MRQNRSNHKRRGGIGLGIARRFAEEGADFLPGEICSVQNIGAAAAFLASDAAK